MKFTKIVKRMKKLFTIAEKGNIKMAIEWNVIDNIVSINWCTIDDNRYDIQDENIKNKFIEKSLMYFKSSGRYLEILKKYDKI